MAFVDLNDSVISQVRQAADIVEFVNAVTPLRAAGNRHKGLCPFHREKTPSFSVDRGKGLFYCFGCGTGGDVFKFLMLTERFTFPEAVEHVASRVGIELPKKSKAKDESKDDLLELMDEAALAYHQALEWVPNAAVTYLEKRGVAPEVWKKYGFGFAPDSWDYLITRLGRRFSQQQMESAGLILPRKQGSGFYDRFRNRLMIPIHSDTGNVIGFGGRSLDGSDPKYLNSPESKLFNKSALLFNLFRARDQIRKLQRAVLVEGYFDCIALDYAGVAGVVASMGTSLTPGQASLMRRYAKDVIIVYDGDEAGRNASLRAAPILLSAGLDVSIVDLGNGYDPDTYVNELGLGAFMEQLSSAQNVFEFAKNRWASNAAAMSAREKVQVIDQFVPLLSAVADPVVRNDAAQKLADALRLEFETVWSKVRGKKEAVAATNRSAAPIATGEKIVLRAMFQRQAPDELIRRLRPELFEDSSCRTIFGIVHEAMLLGQTLDFSAIATHLRSETDLTRLSELALSDDSDAIDPQALETTVRLMEQSFLNRRLRELQGEIQEAERLGDHANLELLLQEKSELSRLRHTLK